MPKDEKGTKTSKRDRYWSIMLVGDHGRVIPFRYFKTLAFAVGLVLVLSLAALAILSFIYGHQRKKVVELQKNLEETRVQSAKLRDEKDLCLTQLVTINKQTGELPQEAIRATETFQENRQAAVTTIQQELPEQIRQEAPVHKTEPQVKWSADIRDFRASFDNRQQILKAGFRIYNTSNPRKTLVGRTVVVFKEQDDAPIHWAIVPPVPLEDGKPIGKNGKAFKINNYRTENFVTIRGNNSAEFDRASIYVFTEPGQLIANQEIAFNVDYSPPKPVKPVETNREKTQDKTSAPAQIQIEDDPGLTEDKGTEPAPQSPGGAPSTPQGSVTFPAQPATLNDPPVNPDNRAHETAKPLDVKTAMEPEMTESTIPPPAAEPKPAPQGGLK